METLNAIKQELARLAEAGRLTLPEDFHAGEYVRKPNCQGFFPKGKGWFIYRTDERNSPLITGPFTRQGIVYACAMMLHQASGLEEYRFSEEERSIYIHNHFRSPEELPADREL